MTAKDAVNPLQFYHSTDAELNPGDVIEPGHKINNPNRPSSDDFKEYGHHNFTWMTTVKPHPNAKYGYGANHYEVEPLGLHHPYSFSVARGKPRDPAERNEGKPTQRTDKTWVSLAGAKVLRKVGDDEPRIGDTQ
jgi:hypothetical protein